MGAREAAARSQDWTLSMHTYTQVLSGLTEVVSAHAQQVDSSDEEEAPPAAKKRKKAAKVVEQPAPQPVAKKVKLASHSGRYQKREKNKLVKGYSATDLAAILGQASSGAQEARR